MFLVFYGSSSILSTYIGRIADRTGRPGPLLGVGIMLLSLGVLGYFLTMRYTTGLLFSTSLLLSAFLSGFGSGFYHPLGASVLEPSFTNTKRGRALGINGAFGSIGRAVYPSLFFAAAVFLTTSGSIAFIAALGAVASIVIWLGLSPKKIQGTADEQRPLRTPQARDALTRGVVGLTIVTFARELAIFGIVAWIPIYISIQKGAGVSSTLGLALTIMYASAIVGQPFFGWLIDKFDRRKILAVSTAGSGITILAYLNTQGLVELIILTLFGFFTFTAFPLILPLALDYAPKGTSSLTNALVWGLGTSGGNVIGPLVTGAIVASNYGKLGFAFEIMALATLASAVAAIFLPKAPTIGQGRSPLHPLRADSSL